MVLSIVRPDPSNDIPVTRPAKQATGDPTRTAEPLEASRSAPPNPIPTARLHDPGRYQMLGEHGRGGLGRVTRAHDRDLGRDIAIKELIARSHLSEVRFLREALITARLEHPGIVPVYEAGRWPDGTPFYAMKLVAGRSLRALLTERTTIEDRLSLLHHVIAVADAIAYAHGRSIIHRDLKPANVIVGDFGETIVIDWGLAKDLSAGEEASVGGAPFRSRPDEGLTSTGSVLGTPAYMAPEQERGEPVDQRADVFAIGAMLWELCSLHKLPPDFSGQRMRMLRRSGIDADLQTIILKAVEPDPTRRYRDAGALAADLKAFKAGARIAARRYSLLALLAHWTRRHRALAISVAASTALVTAGVATYVRHIAVERDRAAAANAALVLEHAQLLLRSDPTAAHDLLSSYHGPDMDRSVLLRAEARGLGLSRLHAAPHGQGIRFAQAMADGSFITLGADGTVVRTSDRGSSRVIAQGALERASPGYAATRGWLAYACETTVICVLDVRAERMRPPPTILASSSPLALAFSPSGNLLAAISARGDTAIWHVEDSASPTLRLESHVEHAESIAFVDDVTLVTRGRDGIHIFHLDASGHAASVPTELSLPAADDMTTNSELHLMAVTTTDGELVIVDSQSAQILQRQEVCQGFVHAATILPGRSAIGYACRNGDLGRWDMATRSARKLAHVDGGTSVAAGSADGRYVVAGGTNGSVVVHDTTTGMMTSYLGHATAIRVVLPPTPSVPYILSADAAGEIRLWPLPDSAARVTLRVSGMIVRAVPLAGDGPVIAIGSSPTIAWSRDPGRSGELPGHNPLHDRLAVSKQQPRFVAFGFDDELELWSFDGQPTRRLIRTHHGTVADVSYDPGAPRFTVACRDGSLEEWSSDGDTRRELGSVREPIALMVAIPGASAVVVVATSGALWLADRGRLSYVGRQPGVIASIAASRDAQSLAIANPRGVVYLYDLRTRALSVLASPDPSSQFLTFTPDGTTLAIATTKSIALRPVPYATQRARRDDWNWSDLELPVTHLGFSLDGTWFAAISNHGVWFHRRTDHRWTYYSTGATKVQFGYFSADDRRFVATDVSGRALVFDMHASLFQDAQDGDSQPPGKEVIR
jgi:WD40 repeat protein